MEQKKKPAVGRANNDRLTTGHAQNDTTLTLAQVNGEPRIDSRVLAEHLGTTHQQVRELLSDYADDFREMGILRFQTGIIKGRGQPEKYALLNEGQACLLLTYSRNTAKARALKIWLVKAFLEARQNLDITRAEYLPTYHVLHDEIHVKAAKSSNERYVHINVNRLINEAVGIESGQRGGLDLPRRSMLIVAQMIAQKAMHHAADHKEGYALAKEALNRLGKPLLGGYCHA